MINLTPIDKRVQRRLFEKMRALGKEVVYPEDSKGVLTQADMMTRTTFIKMVSGHESPIVLMGGELTPTATDSEGFGVVDRFNPLQNSTGYDKIYGPRSVRAPKDFEDLEFEEQEEVLSTLDNNEKARPIPGIKSIDVSFSGGVRGSRQATINWTCWSFEEITRLTPHFLSMGKTVLLEWGWIYNGSSLLDLPTFFDENGIRRSSYENYIEEILSREGDMDMMTGVIKNFEYTTREDGAFDCTTELQSVGLKLKTSTIPNEKVLDGNKAVIDENWYQKAKSFFKKGDLVEKEMISYDLNFTLKTFVKDIDEYVRTQMNKEKNIKSRFYVFDKSGGGNNRATAFISSKEIAWEPNKFIYYGTSRGTKFKQSQEYGVWIRWGWFEDNILSKFVSLTSSDNQIVTQFRSIVGNQSVKIRNSKYLETIDLNSYILPGQFSPVERNEKIVIGGFANPTEIKLKGDSKEIRGLAKISKEHFPQFSANSKKPIKYSGTLEQNLKLFSVDPEIKGKSLQIREARYNELISEGKIEQEFESINDSSEFGYLRNMLINTKVLKRAFGTEIDGVESMSLVEAMEALFQELNRPLDFWSFELQEDPLNSANVRIIDEQVNQVDFTKPIPSQRSIFDGTNFINHGIFYFPVWQTNSIVKSQNIVTKVNNAMALTAMYGSNFNTFKYPAGTGFSNEKEGLIFGGLQNSQKDKRNKGLDYAFKNPFSINIGNPNGLASEKLMLNGENDGVFEFILKKLPELKKKVEESERQRESSQSEGKSLQEFGYTDFETNDSIPIPPFSELSNKQKEYFFQNLPPSLSDTIKQKFGAKYDTKNFESYETWKIKSEFLDSISYTTTVHPLEEEGGGDNNKAYLMPLEMELEIDGTGGIYPGNSYHSTYLPKNYQEKTVFQMFDVNHSVDSSGWKTTLGGKMKTTYAQVLGDKAKSASQVVQEMIDNYILRLFNENSLETAKLNKKKSAVVSDALKGNSTENLFKDSGGLIP